MRIWAIVFCLLVCAGVLTGCGGGDDPQTADGNEVVVEKQGTGSTSHRNVANTASPLPIPEIQTGICRIYTPQPGFLVLVDGQLIPDEESGEWLTTPCAVTLAEGSHDIKVAKEGFRDTPIRERITVSSESEVEVVVEPVEDTLGVVATVLDTPYLQAEVGKPIELASLNSIGLETDPFVTDDGLAIYFAGDRPEGKGIYTATRPNPYVEFDSPQLLQVSRGRDGRATPSVTNNSRIVAFAMPNKQRVTAVTRESPLADFVEKKTVQYSNGTNELWQSAQMLGSGKHIYWMVEREGKRESYHSSRNALDERFSKAEIFNMPGGHPCMSRDGLRQYVFDGETLKRARRESTSPVAYMVLDEQGQKKKLFHLYVEGLKIDDEVGLGMLSLRIYVEGLTIGDRNRLGLKIVDKNGEDLKIVDREGEDLKIVDIYGKELKLKHVMNNVQATYFSSLEKIATVQLENYVHSPQRRQYFVSGDEQWLFYCDNPSKNGDLHMVRLSQGPKWGFAAFGKSIPQKRVVASNSPTENPVSRPETFPGTKPQPPSDTEPPTDPRTQPLPYTTHWQQFNTLMQTKQYDAAKQLVEKAQADDKLSKDRELLDWDAEDVRRVIGFWSDVRRSLAEMKPGDPLRFGAAKVTFVKYEKDQITAKTRTKEITRSIFELSPVDLLAIADLMVAKPDQSGQARMGTFLHYDPNGGASSARTRFDRAGEVGTQFYERLAIRVLRQAQQEFERNKIGAGLGFAGRVMEDFPETTAADAAKQLELKAYEFTKWQERGRWRVEPGGQFVAAAGRSANSYLVSPKAYENFELRLEWKTEANGSGGVFFRYRGNGDPNLFGYKIQLADDFGSGRVDPQTTGALFNESGPTRNAVRKRGEWNSLRMRVRGANVSVEINGTKVLDQEAEVTDFKKVSGLVMLDGVPGGITYRKTLLIELPPN